MVDSWTWNHKVGDISKWRRSYPATKYSYPHVYFSFMQTEGRCRKSIIFFCARRKKYTKILWNFQNSHFNIFSEKLDQRVAIWQPVCGMKQKTLQNWTKAFVCVKVILNLISRSTCVRVKTAELNGFNCIVGISVFLLQIGFNCAIWRHHFFALIVPGVQDDINKCTGAHPPLCSGDSFQTK